MPRTDATVLAEPSCVDTSGETLTMLHMAKRKTDQSSSSGDRPKRPPANRDGVPLNVYIGQPLAAALTAFLDSTDPRVSKTATVESSLAAFLARHGFWDLKGNKPIIPTPTD